jgi:hypothetical protein
MELGAERASFRTFQERWQAMKPKKLLEKLDEFEYWLKEFERQRRSLLGAPITRSGNDELVSQRQQVHHSLDDFRLTLLRKYHSLRPFIETYSQCFTLIERKSRMPQIQGVEGEAVVNYCEPLTTQEMGYHRLSRRVNKMKF